MDDLISRQAVLKGISLSCTGQSDVIKAEAALVRYVKKIPSTEPERKKGKWIEQEDSRISGICSACGWESYLYETDVVGMPFCPNCGADMRGDK